MPVATKSGVPEVITAGDTVIVSVGPDLSYPNTGWTMQLVLSLDGRSLKTWDADNDPISLGFIVTLSAADTAKLTPGVGKWTYIFTETSSGQRETGRTGDVIIAPDPTKQLPDSDAAKALKACWAAINALVGSPDQSVSFNGQSYTSRNSADLFRERDRLQVIVDNELRALGLTKRGSAKLILARFR